MTIIRNFVKTIVSEKFLTTQLFIHHKLIPKRCANALDRKRFTNTNFFKVGIRRITDSEVFIVKRGQYHYFFRSNETRLG